MIMDDGATHFQSVKVKYFFVLSVLRACYNFDIQSSVAVSRGNIYNFHNCNVVINQGQANASSSFPST